MVHLEDKNFELDMDRAINRLRAQGERHYSLAHLLEVLSTSESLNLKELVALSGVIDAWGAPDTMGEEDTLDALPRDESPEKPYRDEAR